MAIDIKKNKKSNKICPECNNINFISDYNTGELICGKCGLVLKEKVIDQGPEWRAFNNSEKNKRARTGTPTSLTIFDKGLSTYIDSHDKDFFGNKIKGKKRLKIHRLRKWNNRSRIHDTDSRNLSIAMSELDRLCSQLEIPYDTKKKAAFLYRKARKSGKLKSRNIAGMMTAALYISCRIHKIPRTFKDFAKFSKLNNKSLRKFYRIFVKAMNIKVPTAKPEDFIPKFSNALKLSFNVQQKAFEIIDEIRKRNMLSGKAPTKIAAAVIYISAILLGERRTQGEVAQIANTSEVTIRNRYKEIIKALKIRLET